VQTATTTLAAAIAAAEQQPVHTVTVDWDGNGVNSTASLIPDGDFELGTGLASWSGYVPGGGFVANSTYRDVASGAALPETGGTAPTAQSGSKMRFVAFGAPGTAGGMHGIRLATTVGQQYTATFRVQIPTAPASGTVLRLRAWDRGALVADSTTTSTTASWITLTVTWLPTSQYTWIGIYATGTAAAQVYAFIDNVTVVPSGTLLTIDDLTAAASEIVIDRALSTDVPDAAQLVTGYASAEATIRLGDGTAGRGARSQFSPYDPAGPLFGKQELRRPTVVQLGHRTAAGAEVLPAFTGFLRSATTRADGEVEITALDGAEKMRGIASLPVVAADDATAAGNVTGIRPGLNSQWLIDWLARQAGYYATPPTRSKCVASFTLHGSATPEIGYPYNVSWDRPFLDTTSSVQPPFRKGKFGLALDCVSVPAADGLWVYCRPDPAQPVTMNDGATIFCEGWIYADAARITANAADGQVLQVIKANRMNTAYGVGMMIYTGKLVALVSRASQSFIYAGPTIPADNAWHYTAIQITVSSNGSTMDVTYRLDGTTTTRTALAAGGSVTGNGPIDQIFVGSNYGVPIEAVQMTTEDNTAQWNDAFVPTAILDAGLNELVATPVITSDTDRWALLKDIAAAEYGTIGFDETGRFVFRNAQNTRSAGGSVVATVTAADALLDTQIDRAVDQVRNHITATVKAPTMLASVDAWRPDTVPSVQPGQTITLAANLDKPTSGVSGPLWLQPDANFAGITISSFICNSKLDGTGTIIASGVTAVANVFNGTSVRIICTNKTGSTVYLVYPSSEFGYVPGSPGLVLRGIPIDWSNTTNQIIDLVDQPSVDTYGEQSYPVSSDWLQRADVLTGLFTDLLGQLRKPRPLLTGVRIIEDCRLQLGDRIVVKDTGGLTLGEEYFVVGIRTERSDQGAVQTLTLRQATYPGGWVLGRVGRMKLGTQTRLA
jgi:hypothetical protein